MHFVWKMKLNHICTFTSAARLCGILYAYLLVYGLQVGYRTGTMLHVDTAFYFMCNTIKLMSTYCLYHLMLSGHPWLLESRKFNRTVSRFWILQAKVVAKTYRLKAENNFSWSLKTRYESWWIVVTFVTSCDLVNHGFRTRYLLHNSLGMFRHLLIGIIPSTYNCLSFRIHVQ